MSYSLTDAVQHTPIGYEHIFWALDRIPFPDGEVEMVDYGAGKGRAVVAAAARPYRSVTGVELSASFAEEARKNVVQMRNRRAKAVDIHVGDAGEFPVPASANVFYFFNPFGAETLRKVLGHIRASLDARPRDAFVIFFNYGRMEALLAERNRIRKVDARVFYPQYGCALYRID